MWASPLRIISVGAHPSKDRALVMSGFRCRGSSAGSARQDICDERFVNMRTSTRFQRTTHLRLPVSRKGQPSTNLRNLARSLLNELALADRTEWDVARPVPSGRAHSLCSVSRRTSVNAAASVG